MIRGTPGLHLALTDQQDGRAVCLCMRCGGELYPGETGYVWEDRRICPDCFKRVVTVWLEESSREVAVALGVEVWVL